MERERIKNLFKFVSQYHKENRQEEVQLNVDGKLIPTLRNYQERAVKWMLARENETTVINLLGTDVELPKGGILADEMGLGKTVEVLACVLSHIRDDFEEPALRKVVCKKKSEVDSLHTEEDEEEESDDEVYEPKSKRRKGSKKSGIADLKVSSRRRKVPDRKSSSQKAVYKAAAGVVREQMQKVYESALSEMSCVNRSRGVNIIKDELRNSMQCFCDDIHSNKLELVKCEDCGVWQHATCLGIENGYSFGSVKCPQCWSKSKILPAKATLIITPPSILNQWIQEIEKHVNLQDFKIFVYKGVRGHNYVQPPTLAGYDVVLTSYNVLCSELDFLQTETARTLRHAKKYYSPTSPLVCIDWWRLCLDEAQMVEGFTCKTATMAGKLLSCHRWAVTGTPIQKSLHDLFGLILFLRVNGLESESFWNELQGSIPDLYSFLGHILWRSSKSDVLNELGVPPQKVLTHWLHFSPVEGHFYRTIHSECASNFMNRLRWFQDLDIKLINIDRKELNNLLHPLLGVRQACTHPQVVRGKFIRFKHTMTMDELLEQMILKAKKDADGVLRQVVAAIHGLAGIHIMQFEWKEAAEKYREVLHLSSQYQGAIKIDTLQMIHCLHNLADVLEKHGAEIPPTLRDSELKKEAINLENNYLERYSKVLTQTEEALAKISASVAHQCKGLTLGYTGWWDDLICSCSCEDEEDLLYRITTFLDDNVLPGQTKLSSKLQTISKVHREVSLWLANADSYREEVKDSLRRLELLPKADLIQKAFMCHVNNERRKNKKKSRGSCPICTTEVVLKKYEGHIFSIQRSGSKDARSRNRNNSVDEESDLSDEEKNNEEKENKEGKKLKSVNIILTNKEGSWKPSSHELILQVLANYAKRVNPKWGEEGAQHLALLHSVRKEFRWIRAVWRTISDQVYATDELYMAKLRLRAPLYEGESVKDDIFIIPPHAVPSMRINLTLEYEMAGSSLKQTTGTLFYLQNLQKTGTTEQECPVCREALTDKWSVLTCGHCCCYDCIPTLLKMSGDFIDCPLCRVKTPHHSISYVQSKKEPDFEFSDLIRNHSTKVTAVVSQLLSLIHEDPDVKVLIFSTWEKVLHIITDALMQNGISFRRLETGGEKFKQNLAQFKRPGVNALLLPIKHGSKGLNLTEATHLFFVEPLLNPAEEQQAVGRIHRIGQTKPTFVHRFVINNSIEERMLSSLETSGAEEWAKENITLRKLNDLFVLKEENTAGPSTSSH